MPQLNVGLVGFGLAGRTLHAPLIVASGMRIAAVVTRQNEAVRESFPEAQVKSSIEALFEVQPLDLVVVVSPNRWHYAQGLLALQAGKHVVVDKPLATTAAEGAALAQAAGRAGRKLAVFHNRRWDSDFLTMRALLEAGTLASFRKSGIDTQEAQLKAGLPPTDRRFGLEPQTQWGRLTVGATAHAERVEPKRGVWLEFYRQMRLAIENDAPVPVTAGEACGVLHIIESARQSAAQRRVVEL